MQKMWWSLFIMLVVLPVTLASDLYMHESLDISLQVSGNWTTTAADQTNSINADLLLVPQSDFRQDLLSWKTTGEKTDQGLHFSWTKPLPVSASLGYTTLVHTKNIHQVISHPIPFPLSSVQLIGVEEYLQPTATIDSQNPIIIKKAAEITQSQTDLFKATFVMASWVEQNVKYNISNTLTATASQKASWVLENKEGVCDEMTSLFIAMARSQGVPARFVSGISYTTDPSVVAAVGSNWAPHGWAEVYFPTIGWVPFDITFGEYGYIDVTHIKMRESADPATPATTYQWFGNNVELITTPLSFDVTVTKGGNHVQEPLELEYTLLDNKIEFGSYNLIKAIVKNTADSYTATTLHLAAPTEISILGRNRRTVLLTPKEVRETYWVVRAPQDLDTSFIYNFPFLIYTEKNLSIGGTFTSKPGSRYYSQQDIAALTIHDEEKSYSRELDLSCDVPSQLFIGQIAQAHCTLTNRGNTTLKALQFCVEKSCIAQDVNPLKTISQDVSLATSQAGFTHIILSAENELVEKRVRFPYLVSDNPSLNVSLIVPSTAQLKQPLPLTVKLTKTSFSVPHNVHILLQGAGFEHTWTLDELASQEELVLELSNPPISFNNEYTVQVTWESESGSSYSVSSQASLKGEAKSWKDKVVFAFNSILGIFS
ncbi:transglutaminase domain-containing protein [Candidatus Woesearchaeota archaeon]|nr:transglutaminase domain-containing protein [Candidatus Woesearchaeota archaeon]